MLLNSFLWVKVWIYQRNAPHKILLIYFLERFWKKETYESSILIFVVIFRGSKEERIKEASCRVKVGINIRRQHIRKLQYQQVAVEEHWRTCGLMKNLLQKWKTTFNSKLENWIMKLLITVSFVGNISNVR